MWALAEEVPEAIYTIPPSSPVYNVTYVRVYESEPERRVWYGYTMGYLTGFLAWGTYVYGSGWYYPPYWHGGGYWPGYYPRPVTYGMGAYYNPVARGLRALRLRLRPLSGHCRRGGLQPAHRALRARRRCDESDRLARAASSAPTTRAPTPAPSPAVATMSTAPLGCGGRAARLGLGARARRGGQGADGGGVRWNTSGGNRGFASRRDGNVYAGRDGNVYRNTGDGCRSTSAARAGRR
ncbi:MAG: hypothetical protein AcusKO_12580 [Acuticoccus sp.]